jgi:hypothetical protein
MQWSRKGPDRSDARADGPRGDGRGYAPEESLPEEPSRITIMGLEDYVYRVPLTAPLYSNLSDVVPGVAASAT